MEGKLTLMLCGRRFTTPPFGVRGSRGWAYSIASPWVPISSLLTYNIYYSLSLTIFELFSWLQQRFRPSADPTRIR